MTASDWVLASALVFDGVASIVSGLFVWRENRKTREVLADETLKLERLEALLAGRPYLRLVERELS